MNSQSVFGLYDVLILVKMSFIGDSGGFVCGDLLLLVWVGFVVGGFFACLFFFFNCLLCNKYLNLLVYRVLCVLDYGTLDGWMRVYFV